MVEFKKNPNKPTVLMVSDHTALHTGFATVAKNIMRHLEKTGKYNLAELGWFAPPPSAVPAAERPNWYCCVTDRSNLWAAEEDKYGQKSLPNVIAKVQPNVVITIGDEWMVSHVAELRDRFGFTWICYCPIDGAPIPPEWAETFAKPDMMIAYGKWGVNVIKQRAPDAKLAWIWHGVDTSVFFPQSPEQKAETRKRYFGSDDLFVVGCVARNQPRKQVPILLKTFAMWSKEHRLCPFTHKPFIADSERFFINSLFYTPSEAPFLRECLNSNFSVSPFTCQEIEHPIVVAAKPNARLYLHMAFEDVGWNLPEQIGRYFLDDVVVHNETLNIGRGVSVAELASLYNALDVFALPTIGEGWGLPYSEAMACGIPILYTDYSAHTEWAGAGGLPLAVRSFYTEPKNNLERAIVDNLHFYRQLDRMYMEQGDFYAKYPDEFPDLMTGTELRKHLSVAGHGKAQEMDWATKINPLWEKAVDIGLRLWLDKRQKEAAPTFKSSALEVI